MDHWGLAIFNKHNVDLKDVLFSQVFPCPSAHLKRRWTKPAVDPPASHEFPDEKFI